MVSLGFIFLLWSILAQIGLRDSRLIFLQYLGKKQHYELGIFIRHMYKDFITSHPNEVLLNSTDLERCFSSGLSHIVSLYAPTKEWALDNSFNWQPIPVHYSPHQKDKPMLQVLSNYIGHTLLPLEAYGLYDTWYVEKLYNRPLPDWASLYYEELKECCLFSFFHFAESPLIQRLRSGSIIGKMIEDMERKIAGDIPQLKVQVYSGQDEHLVCIMKSLKVFNDYRIPYCGTLIFELHEMLDNSKAVRLLFLNSTRPEKGFQVPHVLTLEGCFEYCPLDFFVNYTKHLIPQDWERECGLTIIYTAESSCKIIYKMLF